MPSLFSPIWLIQKLFCGLLIYTIQGQGPIFLIYEVESSK
jgi:hypothetical protein